MSDERAKEIAEYLEQMQAEYREMSSKHKKISDTNLIFLVVLVTSQIVALIAEIVYSVYSVH